MIQQAVNSQLFIDQVNSYFANAELEQPLNTSMNAALIIAALNSAFSSYAERVELTSSMNANLLISAVNYNLSLTGDRSSIKFLHISDVHNHATADAIEHCRMLMNQDYSIAFTLLTGDYTGYDGSFNYMTPALQKLNQKILMLNGNHDIYDGFSSNQANATAYLKSIVTNSNVHWGDTNGIASYYYYDIILSDTSKLRIISVDAYNYSGASGWSKYDTIYSQTLVDWIVARMTELRSTDYFIIAMHEPPVNSSLTNYSYNVNGRMDDDIVALRRSNDFCSARLFVWDTSLSNGNLFPMIIDAYQKKQSMSASVSNTNSLTSAVISTIECDYDFSLIEPATFLFYIGGHLHGDFAEYHPLYQDQLILLVDCSYSNTLGNSSDIGVRSTDKSQGNRSDGILINEVLLDFDNQETTITRIGQNSAEAYNGFPAILRETITFPFNSRLSIESHE